MKVDRTPEQEKPCRRRTLVLVWNLSASLHLRVLCRLNEHDAQPLQSRLGHFRALIVTPHLDCQLLLFGFQTKIQNSRDPFIDCTLDVANSHLVTAGEIPNFAERAVCSRRGRLGQGQLLFRELSLPYSDDSC